MNNISKSEKYSDGDYKFIKLSNGDSEFNRITCESDSICIIPFDTNNGKIKNLYLFNNKNIFSYLTRSVHRYLHEGGKFLVTEEDMKFAISFLRKLLTLHTIHPSTLDNCI